MALNMINKPVGVQPPNYAAHMGEPLVSKPVVSSISNTKKHKGTTLSDLSDTQVVHPGVTIPASKMHLLSFLASRTINLGNYESCKIEVGLTVPCDKDGLEEAYTFAEDFCGGKIEWAVKVAKGEL